MTGLSSDTPKAAAKHELLFDKPASSVTHFSLTNNYNNIICDNARNSSKAILTLAPWVEQQKIN